MDYEWAQAYLLSKPDAVADHPFGPEVLVPKIKGLMFATLSMNNGSAQMNLKCEPHQAIELRDLFAAVKPGYHMNKQHWNTVLLDGSIPQGELERMIDHSYALVVKKLKKAQRQALELSYGKAALYKD